MLTISEASYCYIYYRIREIKFLLSVSGSLKLCALGLRAMLHCSLRRKRAKDMELVLRNIIKWLELCSSNEAINV